MDKMTHSVNTSQLLSPATPVTTQWTMHEQVAMVAGMEVMHGLSHLDFHSLRPVQLWPLPSAQSADNRDQH